MTGKILLIADLITDFIYKLLPLWLFLILLFFKVVTFKFIWIAIYIVVQLLWWLIIGVAKMGADN